MKIYPLLSSPLAQTVPCSCRKYNLIVKFVKNWCSEKKKNGLIVYFFKLAPTSLYMTDFNGLSTHLVLFYTKKIKNPVHCTFIFKFFFSLIWFGFMVHQRQIPFIHIKCMISKTHFVDNIFERAWAQFFTVKWFYTQSNDQTVLFQTIQFNIRTWCFVYTK